MASNENNKILSRMERIDTYSNLDPNKIMNSYKMELIDRYLQEKTMHPELHSKALCKTLKISSSTINRTRRDLGLKSFYQYDIPLNKKVSKKSSTLFETGIKPTSLIKDPPPTTSINKRGRKKDTEITGGTKSEISTDMNQIRTDSQPLVARQSLNQIRTDNQISLEVQELANKFFPGI